LKKKILRAALTIINSMNLSSFIRNEFNKIKQETIYNIKSMKNYLFTIISTLLSLTALAQNGTISGVLYDANNEVVIYANVLLHSSADDKMVKVETTDLDGKFKISGIADGTYYLMASYVGMDDINQGDLIISGGNTIDLGDITFAASSVELETAVITAKRALVEVKPDRTVFNVEGTINSAGENGLSLMRKAPGVLVDNNNNISVLSRSGVLIYLDGKRLPLSGEDLSNYLQGIPAEQIDKIDIITNPGARYEAEGNAGIIDIRLKKDKSHGANGTISGSAGMGQLPKANGSITGNYRNSKFNAFGTLGAMRNEGFNDLNFKNFQNELIIDETNRIENKIKNINYRLGTDYYLADGHILGFLVTGRNGSDIANGVNNSNISTQNAPMAIDSILRAGNETVRSVSQYTANANYRYQKNNKTFNVDFDFGRFNNDGETFQPNEYFGETGAQLSSVITAYDTPRLIDIYTGKIDYETEMLGGKIGVGTKYGVVASDNTFLFYDVLDGEEIQNDRRSNQFDYNETVTAGYVNYNRSVNQKISFSTGLRVEHTDSKGELMAFLPELQEPPVDTSYTNIFPTVGISYQYAPMHAFSANYGRRINRPDYNVLNPFKEQLSILSFSRGNPFLRPEIVNNIELGYTYQYRYNLKIAYSRTSDQITRLIGPDEEDPRAGFINWDNLATQTVWSANLSLPFQFTDKWNAFFNLSSGYTDNQAEYPNGAVVDVQAFSYNIYSQQTYTLPGGFTGEISGYFNGPGVWGGVFKYNENWSLNLGLQKKFLNNNLNVKISAQDLFFQSGWDGQSEFDGLVSVGAGNWDSRRANISVSYNFGNNNVKSRKRKTGIESESKRVGG